MLSPSFDLRPRKPEFSFHDERLRRRISSELYGRNIRPINANFLQTDISEKMENEASIASKVLRKTKKLNITNKRPTKTAKMRSETPKIRYRRRTKLFKKESLRSPKIPTVESSQQNLLMPDSRISNTSIKDSMGSNEIMAIKTPPKESIMLQNPLSKRLAGSRTRTPNPGRPGRASKAKNQTLRTKLNFNKAWNDIRFQPFYAFSRKIRDERTMLDELFMDCEEPKRRFSEDITISDPAFLGLENDKIENRNTIGPGSRVRSRNPFSRKVTSSLLESKLGEKSRNPKTAKTENFGVEELFGGKENHRKGEQDQQGLQNNAENEDLVQETRLTVNPRTKKISTIKLEASYRDNQTASFIKVYCLIRRKKFVFLRTFKNLKPESVIDFELVKPQLVANAQMRAKKRLRIHISEVNFLIDLIFKNKTDFQMFLGYFRAARNKADPFLVLNPKFDPYFYKKLYVTEDQFLRSANSGDVLLFQSKGFTSSVQRGFFGSRFDHVSLVIRSCSDKALERQNVMIFEAMGGSGVQLISWDTFKSKNWEKLYTRVVVRKVNIDRTITILNKIQEFINKTVGKKYQILNFPFFKRDGYFCSELISLLFEELGILKKGINPNKVLPKDFDGENFENMAWGRKFRRKGLALGGDTNSERLFRNEAQEKERR